MSPVAQSARLVLVVVAAEDRRVVGRDQAVEVDVGAVGELDQHGRQVDVDAGEQRAALGGAERRGQRRVVGDGDGVVAVEPRRRCW